MKKERVYTVVFVLSSILAITAMLYSINNKAVVNEDTIDPISSVEKKNVEEEYVPKADESRDSKNGDNDTLIDEINENNEENKNVDDDSDTIEKENNTSSKNIDNTSLDDSIENEENEGVPVFKVASSKILGSLSLLDKEKLLVIGTKLAPLDYVRIKEYLYMDDRDEGVKNAILLLKERLSDEDYEKVKEIMDEYINIDSIEKEDKN